MKIHIESVFYTYAHWLMVYINVCVSKYMAPNKTFIHRICKKKRIALPSSRIYSRVQRRAIILENCVCLLLLFLRRNAFLSQRFVAVWSSIVIFNATKTEPNAYAYCTDKKRLLLRGDVVGNENKKG